MSVVDDDEQVSLRVLAVGDTGSEYLCELRYPRLRTIVYEMSISSEPSPTSAISNIPAAPFTHSSTDVLFTVTVTYSDSSSENEAITLLVPRSTILSQVSRVSASPQKYLEWESWGPTGSRMLKIKPSDVWVCYSYGMKFVHSSPAGSVFAHVYDFNPYATRTDVSSANCPHLPWKAMPMETKIRRGHNPFDIDVITSLPGRNATFHLMPSDHGWEATMITEDHIVLVQVSEPQHVLFFS